MPWRPPISLTAWTSSTGSPYVLPLTATGRPNSKRMVTSSGSMHDVGVPELHAHDRLDGLERHVEVLEGLGLVGGAPDVGVGGVRLLLAVAVGQVVLGEPLAHLGAAAELGDEVGVQPRLVDAQVGVGEQAVAVEPLDVVALEGRAVAPDVDAVLVHGADQHGAGHGAAERGGVEVGAAAGADVEGAAGHRGQALLDELGAAVDRAGDLGAVQHGPVGDAVDVGLVVLADVGGVGARDGALVAHPGHRHRGVEASGEGDADTFSAGQRGEDLAHVGFLTSFREEAGLVRFGRTWVVEGSTGQAHESSYDVLAAGRVARDHHHGVVAGDGAEHVAELGLVERRGQEVRRAGRGAQHDEVGARLGGDEQLLAQPGQPALAGGGLARGDRRPVTTLGGHGVHQRAGGGADLDRVELDEVAAERGLGDDDAVVGEQLAELALRPDLAVVEQVDLELLAGVLGRRDVRRAAS